jgi:hypothetical protein
MWRAGRTISLLLLGLAASGVWWQWRVVRTVTNTTAIIVAYDDFVFHYPTFRYAFGELREGRLPHWNPYQLGGSPFLATGEHGLLYPLNVVFLFLPTAPAMQVAAVLHVFLAFAFTFVLARTMGMALIGAAGAGCVFALSASTTTLISFPTLLYGSSWIPLQIALAHLSFTRPRAWPWAVVLGGTLAMQYLGGYPMFTLFALYGVAGCTLWHVAFGPHTRAGRSARARGLVAVIGAMALAGALAAPQLLPAMELAAQSPRPLGGLPMELADPSYQPGWVQPVRTLVTNILPVNVVKPTPPGVGMVALVLAAFAVLRRPRGPVIFALVMTLASALVALGRHTPLFWLYLHLPGGAMFRLPERLFVFTALGLALLAGFGVDALAHDRRARGVALAVGGICLAAAVTVTFLIDGGALWVKDMDHALFGPGSVVVIRSLGPMRIYLLGIAAWLAAYALLSDRWRRGLVATVPVVLYATLSASFANRFALPELYPDLHTMPAGVVDFLRSRQGYDRTYIVPPALQSSTRQVPSKAGMLYGLWAVADRENVYDRRFDEYSDRMRPANYVEAARQVFTSLGLTFSADRILHAAEFMVTPASRNLRLLDLFGTRFIVVSPDGPPEWSSAPDRFPLVYENDGVRVYANPNAVPRAYLVHGFEVLSQRDEVLDRLTSPSFDPRSTVVLEERPPGLSLRTTGPPAPLMSAAIATYAPQEVAVEVAADAPGILVLTDQYYPGWTAEVDGRPAAIYRANYLFRAVALDAGPHRVVFRFIPRAFHRGVLVATLACATLGIGLAVARFAGRSRR